MNKRAEDSFLTYIKKIPHKDRIIEYNDFDKTIKAILRLEHDMEVIISKFENEKNVVFLIFHGKKLLIADEMSMTELIERLNKMNKVLDKYKKQTNEENVSTSN